MESVAPTSVKTDLRLPSQVHSLYRYYRGPTISTALLEYAGKVTTLAQRLLIWFIISLWGLDCQDGIISIAYQKESGKVLQSEKPAIIPFRLNYTFSNQFGKRFHVILPSGSRQSIDIVIPPDGGNGYYTIAGI